MKGLDRLGVKLPEPGDPLPRHDDSAEWWLDDPFQSTDSSTNKKRRMQTAAGASWTSSISRPGLAEIWQHHG